MILVQGETVCIYWEPSGQVEVRCRGKGSGWSFSDSSKHKWGLQARSRMGVGEWNVTSRAHQPVCVWWGGGWSQNDWGGFLLKTSLNTKTLSWELLQANVTTGICSDWILPDRGKPELGLAEPRTQRQEEKQESLSSHMFSLQAESPIMA